MILRQPSPAWAIELEAKTNVYGKRMYKVADDTWYPSVTTVIGQADPDKQEALSVWRKSVGFAAANAKTKAATDRGTAVHEPLDDWLNDQSATLHEDTPREIMVPYRQIKQQLVSTLDEIWLNEQCLVSHELMTAGRVDLFGVWKGKPAIVDFKTASKKKTPEQIRDYFLQETTYALMYYEMTGVLIDQIVTLIGNEMLFKPQVFERTIYPFVTDVNRVFKTYHQPKLRK